MTFQTNNRRQDLLDQTWYEFKQVHKTMKTLILMLFAFHITKQSYRSKRIRKVIIKIDNKN